MGYLSLHCILHHLPLTGNGSRNVTLLRSSSSSLVLSKDVSRPRPNRKARSQSRYGHSSDLHVQCVDIA